MLCQYEFFTLVFDDREEERQHHFFLAVGTDVLPLIWVGVHDFGVLDYAVNALWIATDFRAKRLAGDIEDQQGKSSAVSFRTCNNEQDLMNAVIVELQRMGEWKSENPLKSVRQFRLHEDEMEFLSQDEIRQLIEAADAYTTHSDLVKVIKLCLSTGARFGEVAKLTSAQISTNKVILTKTKGKKTRAVPISESLYNEISPEKAGPLFSIGYSTVYRFISRTFPRLNGQAAHVLRHTFASHFMMNGGNIIVLQRILGHSDIKQTMRYAHFAPEHLDEALTKNPLSNLS